MGETQQGAANALVGRQPIFDTDWNVHAYELLYRRRADENVAVIDDPSQAASDTIISAFLEIGIDNVVGSKESAFINLTSKILQDESIEALPPSKAVLEILETEKPVAALVDRVKELRGLGYTIALDDFVYDEAFDPLLALTDVVKIDIMATPRANLAQVVENLRRWPVKLLAEKVETREELSYCIDLGFELFQGFVLCRPNIVQHKRMPANKMALVDLLGKVNDPNTGVQDLEEAIRNDVSLSYKLLRYLNSSMFGLSRKVESIRQALVLVGMRQIRSWVSLMALAGLKDKPRELMVTAIVRAQMCSEVAKARNIEATEPYFTTGLFSLLDALIDSPLKQLLEELPLAADINDALLENRGDLGQALRYAIGCEQGRWGDVLNGPLNVDEIREGYIRSLQFADSLISELEAYAD